MNPFSVKDIQALDGRIFAMLSEEEYRVFKFFRAQGRKYGVSANIDLDEVDPKVLASTASQQQTDEICARTNAQITVRNCPP